VLVARAARQPVRLAHDVGPQQPDRKREVADHVPDHRELLVVLAAEHRHVGLDLVENRATTVHTPSKWPGRCAPSSTPLMPGTCTRTARAVPSGYMASSDGIQARSQPAACSPAMSASGVRG